MSRSVEILERLTEVLVVKGKRGVGCPDNQPRLKIKRDAIAEVELLGKVVPGPARCGEIEDNSDTAKQVRKEIYLSSRNGRATLAPAPIKRGAAGVGSCRCPRRKRSWAVELRCDCRSIDTSRIGPGKKQSVVWGWSIRMQ